MGKKRLLKLSLLFIVFTFAIIFTSSVAEAWYVMIIRVNYSCSDGNEAPSSYVGYYDYGDEYYIESPIVFGYTPDKDVISGTFTGTKVYNVTYYPNDDLKYKLTINYLDEDNNSLTEAYVNEYSPNSIYNIESPEIVGYTPDKEVISGTIVKNTTYNVIYSKNEYKLEINYIDTLNNVLCDKYEHVYKYGDNYNIDTPIVNGYTPNKANVSGTISDNLSIDVIYSRNSYLLEIEYLDEDNNNLVDKYSEIYYYGDSYNVESPEIIGYTPDKDVINGTITDNESYKVIYSKNEYNLYVSFKNNGIKINEDEVYKYNYDDEYEIIPYDMYGYTPVKNLYSGVIKGDTYLDIEYNKNYYSLTINYLDEDGNVLHDPYFNTFEYEYRFDILSPEIYGYNTEIERVDDVLTCDKVFNVIYSKNNYTVTINYYDEENNLINSYNGDYKYQDEYKIVTPDITGYTPDLCSVEGIINDNVIVDVHYSLNEYTLIINYFDELGCVIHQSSLFTFKYGDKYEVLTPVIDGFYTNESRIFGYIGEKNIVINIVYHPFPTIGSGNQVAIVITTVIGGLINTLGVSIFVVKKNYYL